jgi:mRNA-degrading endonuclease toxin of MazEF toxin-antitoxin module
VVEVTTTVRGILAEVELGAEEGLFRRSAANADNLAAIPISWLERRIGQVGAAKMRRIEEAIHYALGLSY